MITFLNILISLSSIPKSDLVYSMIHLMISHYQLLQSPKVTSLCPIIHLVMTQISTSPVPKKHIVMSHNSSWRDPKLTFPSQHITLVRTKICLVMTISQLLLSKKVTLFCPIFHLVMTQYQLILSQKVTLFCPIIFLVMTQYQLLLSQKSPNLSHSLSFYDPITTSPVPKVT
jgi:hypothetical protein